MVVDKSAEWKEYRHKILDTYLEDFSINAHKLLDKILDLDCITDESFIVGPGTVGLPQTVMILMGSKDYKPTSKQKLWAGEIAMLKKVLKK